MTPEEFRLKTDVSRETLSSLQRYCDLIMAWQSKMNLVAPSTIDDIWFRHFFDSAQLAKYIQPDLGDHSVGHGCDDVRTEICVDIGSGAGFPGLILALLGVRPLHLVESNKRKAIFLNEAARVLGLNRDDCVVHSVRAQSVSTTLVGTAAVVTARALTRLTDLLGLAAPLLAPGGVCVFPKGRLWRGELAEAESDWKMSVEIFDSETDADARILRISELSKE